MKTIKRQPRDSDQGWRALLLLGSMETRNLSAAMRLLGITRKEYRILSKVGNWGYRLKGRNVPAARALYAAEFGPEDLARIDTAGPPQLEPEPEPEPKQKEKTQDRTAHIVDLGSSIEATPTGDRWSRYVIAGPLTQAVARSFGLKIGM